MVESNLGNISDEEYTMTDKNEKRNKHLTIEDRNEIQRCLDCGMTFKSIGRRIGKDQTTISKEVKKHLEVRPANSQRIDALNNTLPKEVCPRHMKAPFCCNPCEKRHCNCLYQKQYYRAEPAQKAYENLLVEARYGVALSRQSFYDMDGVISEKMKMGQHIYHILQTNNLGVSKSTVYRNLHRGYLSVSKFDCPRVLKFKARKQTKGQYIPRALKIGRTHTDFLTFTETNGINRWVEFDTVIGRIGGKVIMTLHFTQCNFMTGLLLENKTSDEVTVKVTALKAALLAAGTRFGDLIPLALTDNGGEFANIFAIENDTDGNKETALYFCDPMQSCQKAKIEKNHTLFRDIVPKGESFDSFTQETVNHIFSHVNGVTRMSLGGKSPYDLFTFMYGKPVADALGVLYIVPGDVIQSPKLIKNKFSE